MFFTQVHIINSEDYPFNWSPLKKNWEPWFYIVNGYLIFWYPWLSTLIPIWSLVQILIPTPLWYNTHVNSLDSASWLIKGQNWFYDFWELPVKCSNWFLDCGEWSVKVYIYSTHISYFYPFVPGSKRRKPPNIGLNYKGKGWSSGALDIGT
jgi:hypothetical protein